MTLLKLLRAQPALGGRLQRLPEDPSARNLHRPWGGLRPGAGWDLPWRPGGAVRACLVWGAGPDPWPGSGVWPPRPPDHWVLPLGVRQASVQGLGAGGKLLAKWLSAGCEASLRGASAGTGLDLVIQDKPLDLAVAAVQLAFQHRLVTQTLGLDPPELSPAGHLAGHACGQPPVAQAHDGVRGAALGHGQAQLPGPGHGAQAGARLSGLPRPSPRHGHRVHQGACVDGILRCKGVSVRQVEPTRCMRGPENERQCWVMTGGSPQLRRQSWRHGDTAQQRTLHEEARGTMSSIDNPLQLPAWLTTMAALSDSGRDWCLSQHHKLNSLKACS